MSSTNTHPRHPSGYIAPSSDTLALTVLHAATTSLARRTRERTSTRQPSDITHPAFTSAITSSTAAMLTPTKSTFTPTIPATAGPIDRARHPGHDAAVKPGVWMPSDRIERPLDYPQTPSPFSSQPRKRKPNSTDPILAAVPPTKTIREQQFTFTQAFIRSNTQTFSQLHDLLTSYPWAREVYCTDPATLLEPLEAKIAHFKDRVKIYYGAQDFPRWCKDDGVVEGCWREEYRTKSPFEDTAGRRRDAMSALRARVVIEEFHRHRCEGEAEAAEYRESDECKESVMGKGLREEDEEGGRGKKVDSGRRSGSASKRSSVESGSADEMASMPLLKRQRVMDWMHESQEEDVGGQGAAAGESEVPVPVQQVEGATLAQNDHDKSASSSSSENLTPEERRMRNRNVAWTVDVGGGGRGPPWRQLTIGGMPVSFESSVWDGMNYRRRSEEERARKPRAILLIPAQGVHSFSQNP